MNIEKNCSQLRWSIFLEFLRLLFRSFLLLLRFVCHTWELNGVSTWYCVIEDGLVCSLSVIPLLKLCSFIHSFFFIHHSTRSIDSKRAGCVYCEHFKFTSYKDRFSSISIAQIHYINRTIKNMNYKLAVIQSSINRKENTRRWNNIYFALHIPLSTWCKTSCGKRESRRNANWTKGHAVYTWYLLRAVILCGSTDRQSASAGRSIWIPHTDNRLFGSVLRRERSCRRHFDTYPSVACRIQLMPKCVGPLARQMELQQWIATIYWMQVLNDLH